MIRTHASGVCHIATTVLCAGLVPLTLSRGGGKRHDALGGSLRKDEFTGTVLDALGGGVVTGILQGATFGEVRLNLTQAQEAERGQNLAVGFEQAKYKIISIFSYFTLNTKAGTVSSALHVTARHDNWPWRITYSEYRQHEHNNIMTTAAADIDVKFDRHGKEAASYSAGGARQGPVGGYVCDTVKVSTGEVFKADTRMNMAKKIGVGNRTREIQSESKSDVKVGRGYCIPVVDNAGLMEECLPREMYFALPVVCARAVLVDKLEKNGVYRCPCYKTQRRGDSYVFTAGLRTKASTTKWVLAGVVLTMEVEE